MLTSVQATRARTVPGSTDHFFADLRRREFSRLDRNGEAYLDYTGSALYAERQIRAYSNVLRRGVFGNPHSENKPSRASTEIIDKAREQLLEFLDAPPEEYVVCFTANTSAAIKLVAESFPFDSESALLLSTDNHNSVNGIREFAGRAGAKVEYLPLDPDLRLADPLSYLEKHAFVRNKMFAYPAQSNFSGVKHGFALARYARALGYAVLVDAAAFAPTNPISLRATPVDFLALSMYKVFGFPTGVGALVARRDSLRRLRRPWFAGGTVEYASVQNQSHLLRERESGFEDGTPAFLDIAALSEGFELLRDVTMDRLNARVTMLTSELLDRLQSLRRADGLPLVRIYGPTNIDARGGTVAFNVLDRDGHAVPYPVVERAARDAGVAVRGGCFCNPGASESAFEFPANLARKCAENVTSAGFTVEKFSECIGRDIAVGAVRASVGMATNVEDLERLVGVVQSSN
ncbi:MAG TPA: aminotransferase class V-fold PLP-dependent enzyme [Gemmatimonadaceae bacterium]|nr:aminotransferase class V-fold PLP-dependent enzyme [Gemmatimonadaceae bacterium]